MPLRSDTILNERYALVRQLGKGSFGEVWLANDLQLGIEVAVKVYVALDGNGCREFGREYVRMRSLSHTNLLRADHYALFGDRPFLVMEYCPSGAKELIGQADELTLLRFIRDVASGLAYMHEHDMLHRDIKPDNILQKADGTFVLTDFGLSKNMHSTLLRNSSRNMSSDSVDDLFSGTVEYMAPELFTADPLAVKATDVWALGVTLYEIITGELPFFGKGGNMMNYGAVVPNIHAPLSENLIETVRGCMAKEPWVRPTAQALADWAQDALKYFSEMEYRSSRIVYTDPTEVLGTDTHSDYEPPVADTKEPSVEELYTEKPKRKAWPWLVGVAAAFFLLFLAGFMVWKMLPKKLSPEAKLFAECRAKNDVDLYRSYVEQYPNGDSVEVAKAWIKNWEDYLAQAKESAQAHASNTPALADNSKMQKEKKAEKEMIKYEKGKEMKQKEAEKKEDKKDKKKDNKAGVEKEETVEDGQEGKSGKVEVKERGFTKETDLWKISEEHPAQLPPDQSGLTPDTKKTEKQKGTSSNDEEAEANNAKTIDRCCDFVAKYGDKSKYYGRVCMTFKGLYEQRLNKCTTVEECDNFLKKHDYYMQKMKMSKTRDDSRWYNEAKKKKEKLEKEREKAGEQIGDGIIKEGAPRPNPDENDRLKPGISNAPTQSKKIQ